MDPDEGNRKSLKPVTRWLVVPFAFSWLGFVLMAPFALADERFAYGGLIFGFLGGLVVAINDPKWIVSNRKKEAIERSDHDPDAVSLDPPNPTPVLSLPLKLALTGLAAGFAWLVLWAVQSGTADRGLFFFVAAFFVISMVRRTLRRAWGFAGSLAGMLTSGGLLVMLIRSSVEKQEEGQAITWMVAIPFIILEAWDEARSLRRQPS